jgi:hypothetical protein
LAHMSISTYFKPNIHQNGPEVLGVNPGMTNLLKMGKCHFITCQIFLFGDIRSP